MNRSLIETQIKAKVDVQIVDDDENPLNLDDFSVEVSRIREMKIGTRDIEIKYQIAYRATSNEDKLILGSFKFQELVWSTVYMNVECVFPMVIISFLSHEVFGANDQRVDASHFMKLVFWTL